ncbi:MAG: Ig-like domain-containing protein [Pseudomonadota bacterium]
MRSAVGSQSLGIVRSAAALAALFVFPVGFSACGGGANPVPPGTATVAVDPEEDIVEIGATRQFKAFVLNVEDQRAEWSIEGGDANGTIDSQGLYTAPSTMPANPTVTVIAKSVADPSAIGDATVFLVPVGLGGIAALSIEPETVELGIGGTKALKAFGTFKDDSVEDLTDKVTWKSSDEKVATVETGPVSEKEEEEEEDAGLVTALAAGSTTVQAILGALSAEAAITVSSAPALVELVVAPSPVEIALGQTQQLTATAKYSDDSTADVTAKTSFSLDKTNVATVGNAEGSKGLVTAVAQGTATITAEFEAITASIGVTVGPAVLVSIALEPDPLLVAAGLIAPLTAKGTMSDGTVVDDLEPAWTSDSEEIATVDEDGVVTGVAEGSAVVTATVGQVSGTATVMVGPAVLLEVVVEPATVEIPLGLDRQLKATAKYSDGTTADVTELSSWSSLSPFVAAVSDAEGSKGLIFTSKQGVAIVQAYYVEDKDDAIGEAVVTVAAPVPQALAILPGSTTLAVGLAQGFVAMATYSDGSMLDVTGEAVWTSSNETVAKVSNDDDESKGFASAAAPGVAEITAELGELSATARLLVSDAVLASIEISPTEGFVAAGFTVPFAARAVFTDGATKDVTGQVIWSSSDETIAVVSNLVGSSGVATGVKAGTVTITASAGAVASDTAILTVTPAVLKAITVTPSAAQVAAGFNQAFRAIGVFSDEKTQDITTQVKWTSLDTRIATVANDEGSQGLATGLAPGKTTIVASLDGVSGAAGLTVTEGELQYIAVAPGRGSVPVGFTTSFTATGYFSDGSRKDITSQVVWSSSDPAIAKISNDANSQGVATGLVRGTVTIVATSGTVSDDAILDVTAATLQSISVAPRTASLTIGLSQKFAATGRFTDGSTRDVSAEVTWASSDRAVATVSNDPGSQGLATAVGRGTATITATSGTVSGNATLTVTEIIVQSITVTPSSPSVAVGFTQKFTAIGAFSDGSTKDITAEAVWSTSDVRIATVSKGVATGVAAGAANIVATLGGVTGQARLVVVTAEIRFISVSPASAQITTGKTQQFVAMGTFNDGSTRDITADADWSSTDPVVASVSNDVGSKGLATGEGEGLASIVAAYGTIEGSAVVEVAAPVSLDRIQVDPATASVPVGYTAAFKATGIYSDGSSLDLTTKVIWSSSEPTVASISNAAGSQGVATGNAKGTSTIRAVLGEVGIDAVEGTATLEVTAITLLSISVVPPAASVPVGFTRAFNAIGVFSDNTSRDITTEVTWSTGDPLVATISNSVGSKGVATGVKAGGTQVFATSGGVSGSASLTVTIITLTGITVNPAAATIAAGYTQAFTALGTFSDGSTQNITTKVIWTSNNPGVATVSNAPGTQGVATALAAGTANISASLSTLGGSARLTVSPAVLQEITISPATGTIADGQTIQLNAIGEFSDGTTADVTTQVFWASDRPDLATVSNTSGSRGLVTGVAPGTATITASSALIFGSATLTVTNATIESIVVAPADAAIAVGFTQQFTATGIYSDQSQVDLTAKVSWESSNLAVAVISDDGLATGLKDDGGTPVTISASLDGVSATANLKVSGATLVDIAVTPVSASIAAGYAQAFVATGVFDDGTDKDLTTEVTWISTIPAVATVSNEPGSQGVATALVQGIATIKAELTVVDTVFSGAAVLTVTQAVIIGVTVSPDQATVARGYTEAFTATATFSDGSEQDVTGLATWTVSPSGIATVSGGVVTGVNPGSGSVRATYQGFYDTAVLVVTASLLEDILVFPGTATLAIGGTRGFTALAVYSDGSTANITEIAKWTTANESVAVIDDGIGLAGVVRGVTAGLTAVTAASGEIAGSATVTVTAAKLTGIAVTPASQSLPRSVAYQYKAEATFDDLSKVDVTEQVVWSSTNTSVAAVSNSAGSVGVVTTGASGTVTISATFGGFTGTASLSVSRYTLSSIVVTPATKVAKVGETWSYTATATYSDDSKYDITPFASWYSEDDEVVVVSNAPGMKGQAIAVGVGNNNEVQAWLGRYGGQATVTVQP